MLSDIMFYMEKTTRFKAYDLDQLLLLPPDMRQWLPEDDLVYFIIDIVNQLDLKEILSCYDNSKGGQPPYHPRMMVALLIYAYCVGVPSSRKIEQATYHSVPFRVLSGDQHPDHDTIADFRKRHLKALSKLFIQVLKLCQRAGLVKLGHVALDGTKVKANASKHKAMSYGRMVKKEKELKAEVKRLLKEAQACDSREDALYGKGKRGDELPKELRFKESRLKKIQEAMKALEEEALEEAKRKRKEQQSKKNRRGRPPKAPSDKPPEKKQRNFTDPDSRIMKDSVSKSFEQSYNCQSAVDDKAQIIIASQVTQQENDKEQVEPMLNAIKKNLGNNKPKHLSADAGYFSEANCKTLAKAKIDAYVATKKKRHGKYQPVQAPRGRIPKNATIKERMERKLATQKGQIVYGKRKQIVEPVFGQIKEVRGFRRFSLRGLANVAAEWDLICLTHNILKLFRSGWMPTVP
jgi:transposase